MPEYDWTEEVVACGRCGGATVRLLRSGIAHLPLPDVRCDACWRVQHAEEQIARRARRAIRQREFSDWPMWAGRALIAAGFTSRAVVAAATDAELLAAWQVGPKVLAIVRAAFPAPEPLQRCPHCDGTGYG
jgi:hypothetical protein